MQFKKTKRDCLFNGFQFWRIFMLKKALYFKFVFRSARFSLLPSSLARDFASLCSFFFHQWVPIFTVNGRFFRYTSHRRLRAYLCSTNLLLTVEVSYSCSCARSIHIQDYYSNRKPHQYLSEIRHSFKGLWSNFQTRSFSKSYISASTDGFDRIIILKIHKELWFQFFGLQGLGLGRKRIFS